MPFTVIPAIDLKAGRVVLANATKAKRYIPLSSLYGDSDDPLRVLSWLVRRYSFRSCYIADIDAIQGRSPQSHSIERLQNEFLEIDFWLDSGDCVQNKPTTGNWHRVLGSGSIALTAPGRDYILSLDFPTINSQLHNIGAFPEFAEWPGKVILMELGLVGSCSGPNISRLQNIKALCNSKLYLSGGIRHYEDLLAAAKAKASGALCATALYNGNISPKQIAKLQSA
ncbi:MAG: HisA/HisF-related TIM barrel protein [Candidatus Porifericomitaceae bacterium WSBS_2022_MAG_OTU9]